MCLPLQSRSRESNHDEQHQDRHPPANDSSVGCPPGAPMDTRTTALPADTPLPPCCSTASASECTEVDVITIATNPHRLWTADLAQSATASRSAQGFPCRVNRAWNPLMELLWSKPLLKGGYFLSTCAQVLIQWVRALASGMYYCYRQKIPLWTLGDSFPIPYLLGSFTFLK